MKQENVNLLKFRYLIAEFKVEQNPKFAIDICNMLVDGALKVSGTSKDGRTLFIRASRYQSKCVVCGDLYVFGDPIFVKDQKAWHLKCASEDDLKHPYFAASVEKGLVEEFGEKENMKFKPKKINS